MPLKHACFISYAHGGGQLIESFIKKFSEVLSAELETYFEEDIWIDRNKLEAGNDLESALATAICQSVCIVVVFFPRYTRREWCMRELAHALRIEKERFSKLKGHFDTTKGLIIPVVLRGDEDDMPELIKKRIWVDFKAFSLADPDITHNPEHVKAVEKMAKYIHDVYKDLDRACRNQHVDILHNCNSLLLEEPVAHRSARQFPGR